MNIVEMQRTRKQVRKKRKTVKRGGFKKPVYMNTLPFETYFSLLPKTNINATPFIKAIESVYNSSPYKLHVGTLLYRSTFEKDPMDFFSYKKDLLFFGLDSWIAVWYGLEMWQRYKKDRHSISYGKWLVYLHVYEVKKPITYEYLEDIETNPKNDPYYETCLKKPCVHPQVILHGDNGLIKEYGTELTLPYDYNIKLHIVHKETYTINLIRLLEMQDQLSEWIGSPLESVLEKQ